MCNVLHYHLGKENPLRVFRCIQSGLWFIEASSQNEPSKRIAVLDHSQGQENRFPPAPDLA